jgi:hypothetical protein
MPLLFLALLLGGGCASYYQRNADFQARLLQGDYEAALSALDGDRRAARGGSRLLYRLQRGVTLHLLGRYEESNDELEQAYRQVEELRRNYAAEALGLLSNPGVVPYRGEDFEVVQIHYYKALNDLLSGRYEEALVECRRLNIRLNQINDRYSRGATGSRIRYSTDAFALNLMGIIFEAAGEMNDAFISYRNAYEAYRDVYRPNFHLPPPAQLRSDLLRAAYANGFTEELEFYEREFGTRFDPQAEEGEGSGTVVVFWNNGLGPVKEEWSLNFAAVRGEGGVVTFVNRDLGLSFPFKLEGGKGDGSLLEDLRLVRVAFPRYRERAPVWGGAELEIGETKVPLEPAQDLNAIAFSGLEDRMVRELATSLLRLALKQAAEYAARREDQTLGTLLSIVNAVTESADTRNWQTLPYSVSYARVRLPEGSYQAALRLRSAPAGRERIERFPLAVRRGETRFVARYTLDSRPPAPRQ